jgi:mono/diheme cytochrome c family protein
MNPRFLTAIVFVFFELFAIANVADACNRCGIFGRGCRYVAPAYHAPVYHAPAVVKEVVQRDVIQNLIFNNIAPPGDLSPRGDTVYGVSRALEYSAPSSALYLDNTRRLIETASEFTAAARGLDSEILDVEKTNARGRAVEAAFRALRDETSTTRSTTTRITLRNGVPVFEEEVPAEPIQPRAFAGFNCATCHGPEGKAAKAFLLDGPLSLDDFARAKEAVEAGTMPPKSNLTESERLSLVAKLGGLVE